MLPSQKRVALEKSIRSKSQQPDQQHIIKYLQIWFNDDLTQWIHSSESKHPEQLRGEMACLKNIIEILSDSKLELFQGDE